MYDLTNITKANSTKRTRIIHGLKGTAYALSGVSTLTIGSVFTVIGIAATATERKLSLECANTTLVGAGLMFGGYKLYTDGLRMLGDSILDTIDEDDNATKEPDTLDKVAMAAAETIVE